MTLRSATSYRQQRIRIEQEHGEGDGVEEQAKGEACEFVENE